MPFLPRNIPLALRGVKHGPNWPQSCYAFLDTPFKARHRIPCERSGIVG